MLTIQRRYSFPHGKDLDEIPVVSAQRRRQVSTRGRENMQLSTNNSLVAISGKQYKHTFQEGEQKVVCSVSNGHVTDDVA